MRRALSAIAVTAAGLTWLLRAQGVIDRTPLSQRASVTTTPQSPTNQTGTGDTGSTTTTVAGAPKVVDGPTIDTRWGPVQVEAVLKGGRLTDVKVLQYPNERNRSVEINSQALPILHDEAIQAQSANLDQVSGATYTWTGYTQSLQSALDQAGFHH